MQWPALVVFAVGVAVTLLAASFEHVRNRERTRAEFERRANRIAADLRTRLELPVESLQSVAAFFDASEDVSRDEFGRFVRSALARYPGIRALEWIPVVPSNERAAYVARARADGISAFKFKEEGPNLTLVSAAPRAEHLPIFYMEPPDPTALGFDVAASPFRRAPADRAKQVSGPVASERIRLVEDAPDVASIAVFYPVRSQTPPGTRAVRGFVAEVFRVRPFVEPVFRSALSQGDDLVIVDTSAPPALRLLFSSSPSAEKDANDPSRTRHTSTFPFAERRWAVTVVASPAQERSIDAWPVGMTMSGLVISTLLALTLSTAALFLQMRKEMRAALRLGQYTLVEKIGEGGMGVVYRARHSMLRRATAVKLLLPSQRGIDDVTRFEREVQLTSQLCHPNTIAIYDYGRTPDGIFYYVMEYLEGLALEELVRNDGPMPPARVVRIALQVCGALEEAHRNGIVHRDIKPANLMLMERGGIPDFVKVLDFGLVKENSPEISLGVSQGTPLLGTPLYMSPEAIISGKVDARADLYALGAVAYYLLTGTTVFRGENMVDVCAQHLSVPPTPPSQRTTRPIPPSLDALVLRCLEKKPENRPASARALAIELRSIEMEIGAFSDDDAERWWNERGHELMRDLGDARRIPAPGSGGHIERDATGSKANTGLSKGV
jgi:serine/threonine-protein kinase